MSFRTNMMTLLVLLSLPFVSAAQNKWEATLGVGYTNYQGDLVKPIYTFKGTHLAYELGVRRYLDNNYNIRFNILRGKLSGDDRNWEGISGRGNSFETNYTEISILHEVDLRGHKRFTPKHGFRTQTTPFIFLGMGLTLAKPDVTYGSPDSKDLQYDYPGWHVSFPIGGGIKKDLNEQIFLSLQYGLRLTLTDNLDGTQESGNAYRNDTYIFGGLVAGYRFLDKPKVAPKSDVTLD